jgi:hypothetical protein
MNQEYISEEMSSRGQMTKDNSFWIKVGLYISLLVWIKIWYITLQLV